jgi:hypothetical protein
MACIGELSSDTLVVEPGRSANLTFTVRNTGSVVDRFSFDALGSPRGWVTFAPESVSLFPEASAAVQVRFSPPRDPTVTAGRQPFGIKVLSSEDPEASVVEEGTLEVGAFSDVAMELVPRVSRGRTRGRAQLAVDNRSNVAYRAALSASDPAQGLRVSFNPATVDVAPGGAFFAKVAIRPETTFWRGPSLHKTFTVAATQGESTTSTEARVPHPDKLQTEGSFMQEAMLPPWLLKAVAAAIALAVLGVILWFTLLKPQVKNTAQAEVNKQLAASGAVPPSGGSGSPSSGGGSSGGAGGGSAGGAGTITTAPAGNGSTGTTSSSVAVNGTRTVAGDGTVNVIVVPSGHVLEVTDLLVQNPAGNSGTLALARSGASLMEWSLANFRDLDYHWIVPIQFNAGTVMQLVVKGCSNPCSPGIYYAGNLVKS